MSEIFFPLASNINCFQSNQKRLNIEGRIKQALLIYDRLCYEDGIYRFTVLKTGSLSGYDPPEYLTDKDTEFRYFDRPVRNKPFLLAVAPEGSDGSPIEPFQPIMSGPIDYQFIACYRALIEEIVHEGVDPSCFQPIPWSDLHSDIKKEISQWVRSDEVDSEISKAFSKFKRPGTHWLKKTILENLNRDFLVAQVQKKALSVDQLHLRVLQKKLKHQQDPTNMASIPEGLVLDAILQTRIPNLSKLPWNAIFDVRVSRAWNSFRQLLGEIAQRVSERYDALDDPNRFHEESRKYFLELWSKQVTNQARKLFKDLLKAATKTLGPPAAKYGLENQAPVVFWLGLGTIGIAGLQMLRDWNIRSKHWSSVVFMLEKACEYRV